MSTQLPITQDAPQKLTLAYLNKFQPPEYEKVHLPTIPHPNKNQNKQKTACQSKQNTSKMPG